jgi:ABC-type oligopeptide transport system ATPase subunit
MSSKRNKRGSSRENLLTFAEKAVLNLDPQNPEERARLEGYLATSLSIAFARKIAKKLGVSPKGRIIEIQELNKIGREIADNNKHKEVIAEIQAMQEACQDAHEVTGDSSLNFKQRHIPKGQLAQAV